MTKEAPWPFEALIDVECFSNAELQKLVEIAGAAPNDGCRYLTHYEDSGEKYFEGAVLEGLRKRLENMMFDIGFTAEQQSIHARSRMLKKVEPIRNRLVAIANTIAPGGAKTAFEDRIPQSGDKEILHWLERGLIYDKNIKKECREIFIGIGRDKVLPDDMAMEYMLKSLSLWIQLAEKVKGQIDMLTSTPQINRHKGNQSVQTIVEYACKTWVEVFGKELGMSRNKAGEPSGPLLRYIQGILSCDYVKEVLGSQASKTPAALEKMFKRYLKKSKEAPVGGESSRRKI